MQKTETSILESETVQEEVIRRRLSRLKPTTRIIYETHARKLCKYNEILQKQGKDATFWLHWAEKFAKEDIKRRDELISQINTIASDPFPEKEKLRHLCNELFKVEKRIIEKFLKEKYFKPHIYVPEGE
jgi:hypothetical protein